MFSTTHDSGPPLSGQPRTPTGRLGVSFLRQPVRLDPEVKEELRTLPHVTLALIVVLVSIHLLAPAEPQRLFGAYRPSVVTDGEWYRLFTSGFVHVDAPHLLMNCWSLMFFGWIAERVLGWERMLALFVGAGVIAGGAFIVVFDDVRICGSSSGVTALTAAVLPFGAAHWSKLKPLFRRVVLLAPLILGIVLYQDLQVSDARAFAHIPGLVVGLVVGVFYRQGVAGVSESTLRPARAEE